MRLLNVNMRMLSTEYIRYVPFKSKYTSHIFNLHVKINQITIAQKQHLDRFYIRKKIR